MHHAWQSARRHGDVWLALALAAGWLSGPLAQGLPHGHRQTVFFLLDGVLLTLPFAWRRSRPLLSASVLLGGGSLAAWAYDAELPIGYVLVALLAGYSLGAHYSGRRSMVAAAVLTVALGLGGSRQNDAGFIGFFLTPVVFVFVPWCVGQLVARLRQERSLLKDMTVLLEAEQEDRARSSVLEERSRIARELHDIVAHSISVMVIQAGAAEQYVGQESPASTSLLAIRETGQQALVEMRRLLGVLRDEDSPAMALAPQPGLANLDVLLEAARGTGLTVTVDRHGMERSLPPGLDVAAYRLVQEALNNVRKHARARSTSLLLTYDLSCLTIEVTDDGVGSVNPGATGHGLTGMRERVVIYGGRLECGPRTGGGWRVRAQLPIPG